MKIKLFEISLRIQNLLGNEMVHENKTFKIYFITSSMKISASNITHYGTQSVSNEVAQRL